MNKYIPLPEDYYETYRDLKTNSWPLDDEEDEEEENEAPYGR